MKQIGAGTWADILRELTTLFYFFVLVYKYILYTSKKGVHIIIFRVLCVNLNTLGTYVNTF